MRVRFILIFLCFCLHTFAQQKDFEGVVIYQNKVESKVPEISNGSWQRNMVMDDIHKVYIRRGFYKHVNSLVDVYYHPADQKIYYKYKGIDTLFYKDYTYDSSKLKELRQDNNIRIINNVKCNRVTAETNRATLTYDYSPLYHIDPAYDRNNTSDRYDVYIQTAKSVYLALNYDCSVFNYIQTATLLQSQILDDSIFRLPNLPKRKYSFESIGTSPQFKGGIPAYIRFLETNLNAQLGPKYIKLPKREPMATQTVTMQFIVDEKGTVRNIEVLNEREVHPKLADEAIRVMKNCPAWKPAILFGKPIVYRFGNSVTFAVTR